MSDEIPSTIVSQLCFVGREGGLVKTLSGFQKGRHTLPTAVNDTTLAFLAKLCAADLAEHAEARFQQIRAGLGYKRRELSLSIQSPAALLTAAGFSFEMAYGLEEADPSRYTVTHTLRGLRDPALARHPAFDATFAGTFSNLLWAEARGAGGVGDRCHRGPRPRGRPDGGLSVGLPRVHGLGAGGRSSGAVHR